VIRQVGTRSKRLSYWQQEAATAAVTLPNLDPPGEADIAVVGGGLAGVSTSIAILQRQPGTRVVLLEGQVSSLVSVRAAATGA
jgi:hypothetical protein